MLARSVHLKIAQDAGYFEALSSDNPGLLVARRRRLHETTRAYGVSSDAEAGSSSGDLHQRTRRATFSEQDAERTEFPLERGLQSSQRTSGLRPILSHPKREIAP